MIVVNIFKDGVFQYPFRELFKALPDVSKRFFENEEEYLNYKRGVIKTYISYFFHENTLWLENEMNLLLENKIALNEKDELVRVENLRASCEALGDLFQEYVKREVKELEEIFTLHEEFKIDGSSEIIIKTVKVESEEFLQRVNEMITFQIFMFDDQIRKSATPELFNQYLLFTQKEKEMFFSRNLNHEKDIKNIYFAFLKAVGGVFEDIIQKGEKVSFVETQNKVRNLIDALNEDLLATETPKVLVPEQQKSKIKFYCLMLWEYRYLINEKDILALEVLKFLI